MKVIALALAGAMLGGAAAQAQDIANGEQIFNRRCKTCHMIVAPDGETIVKGGRTGPNQYGLIGAKAAHDPDFARYSDSLQEAAEQGLVWTEAEVVKYLEDPRAYLRAYLDDNSARSAMAFKLRDEADRADVAAYLAQYSSATN